MNKTLNDASVGRVLCGVASLPVGSTDEQCVAAFLREKYRIDIDPAVLTVVPGEDAAFVLHGMFRGWLFEVASAREADALTKTCFSWFDANVRCYSTYRFRRTGARQYTFVGKPLIGDTHDVGVLLADQTSVGVVWLCDAD